MRSMVVVVEDEELIAFFIRETLELEGYDVVCFAQGQEARRYLQGNGAACAIIDVGLPDIAGDELAREIRRSHPDIPVILATGYSASHLEELFTGDTGLCVLPKPFNETRLIV